MNGYHSDPIRSQIREVWADNLEEEFKAIRDVVERYQYIAMDTEFPGIVARPTGTCTDYNYQTVKCNVDLLKVIQLGITFADARGNLAQGISTWQFNFSFNLERDMYAQDSIDFLKQSGIDFEKQQTKGIALQDFGELIMSSGLVMNEDVKWISFHGSYDFGYLLKLLTCTPLPQSEAQFFELLHDFFPALYDIKFLLMNIRKLNFNGGLSLQKIADHLNVKRIGRQHQAGSDSLITCRTFFKLMEEYFDNQIDDSKFSGVIYGLGAASAPKPTRSTPPNQELMNGSTSYSTHTHMATCSSQSVSTTNTSVEEKLPPYYISPMELNPYNNTTHPTIQQAPQPSQSAQQPPPPPPPPSTSNGGLGINTTLNNNVINTSSIINTSGTSPSGNTNGFTPPTPPNAHTFDTHQASSMMTLSSDNLTTLSNVSNTSGGGLLGSTLSNSTLMEPSQTYPLSHLLNQIGGNSTGRETLTIHSSQPHFITHTQGNFSLSSSNGRVPSPHALMYTNNDYSEQPNIHRG